MSQASLRFTNTGQLVNIVTNDVQKFEEVRSFFEITFYPRQ